MESITVIGYQTGTGGSMGVYYYSGGGGGVFYGNLYGGVFDSSNTYDYGANDADGGANDTGYQDVDHEFDADNIDWGDAIAAAIEAYAATRGSMAARAAAASAAFLSVLGHSAYTPSHTYYPSYP